MIITRKKDITAIIESLKGKKTVYLFGCDSCAEQCATGGARVDPVIDDYLIGMVRDHAFGFGL